jgi:hypothetical protein
VNIEAIFWILRKTVGEGKSWLMRIVMRVALRMEFLLAREYIHGLMVQNMKESL